MGRSLVTVIGVVKEIWRFPVKSMQGSTIETCTVTKTGIPGDRGWAMRDEERQEIQWGKRHPELMLCSASYQREPEPGQPTPVEVTFPDGETLVTTRRSTRSSASWLAGGRLCGRFNRRKMKPFTGATSPTRSSSPGRSPRYSPASPANRCQTSASSPPGSWTTSPYRARSSTTRS